MTHDFKFLQIPENILQKYHFTFGNNSRNSQLVYKQCTKCNLVILIDYYACYCRFYMNNIEIYEELIDELELELSCEEFIIKNIIE